MNNLIHYYYYLILFVWFSIGTVDFGIQSITSAVPTNSNRLVISKGEGFIAFLQHTSNFSTLIQCHVVRPQTNDDGDDGDDDESNPFAYDLIVHDQQIPVIYETEYHEFIQRWTNDGGNICGVRVFNTSEWSTGTWNLLARDATGLEENGTVSIENGVTIENPVFKNVTSIFGTTHTICASSRSPDRFCRLRQLVPLNTSSNGNVDKNVDVGNYVDIDADDADVDPNLWITYQCSTGYSFLQIENTQWLCKTLTWGKINEISEYVSVWVEPATPITEGTLYEFDSSIVLTCRSLTTAESLSGGCRAISPNKRREFLLFEGFSNENYSAFDTIPSLGICSIEIRKPIKFEDIGIWKILHVEKSMGCIFNVGNSEMMATRQQSPIVVESNDENDPIKIEIMSSDQLIIRCEAPYILDICFLLLPNLQLKFVPFYDFQRQRHIGLCEFRNLEKLPGHYVCGFNKYELTNQNSTTESESESPPTNILPPSIDDYRDAYVNIHYAVHIYDGIYGETERSQLTAQLDENITMLCTAAFAARIEHCAFISPHDEVYLFNDQIGMMNGRIQYFGSGLVRGQCGMAILGVQSTDFGQWTCNFKINYGDTQNLRIELERVEGVATGLIIGLSVSGFLLAMIIGGALAYLIYRFKLRQQQQQQQLQQQLIEQQPGHSIAMGNLNANETNSKMD